MLVDDTPELLTGTATAAQAQQEEVNRGSQAEAAGQHEPAAQLGRRLVGDLVEAGAVPPLLRLRGLGYPRRAPCLGLMGQSRQGIWDYG